MHPPARDGGPAGLAGSGGTGGRSDAGGAGGASGTGGGGTGGVACPGPPPNDASVDGAACTAKFNFESGVQGANIPAGGQVAFTAVATSSADTFCGAGALALTASFSGTSGNTTKGIVEIPIAPADMDFTGKTVTVHVSAVPGCSTDLGLAVVLRTDSGALTIVPTQRPIDAPWKTLTATLSSDAGGSGVSSVMAISLQAFSVTGYQGTIYIDEVSVTGP